MATTTREVFVRSIEKIIVDGFRGSLDAHVHGEAIRNTTEEITAYVDGVFNDGDYPSAFAEDEDENDEPSEYDLKAEADRRKFDGIE